MFYARFSAYRYFVKVNRRHYERRHTLEVAAGSANRAGDIVIFLFYFFRLMIGEFLTENQSLYYIYRYSLYLYIESRTYKNSRAYN